MRSGMGHLQEIENLVRSSEKLILATDPDREGEAISWHIQEELKVSMIYMIACFANTQSKFCILFDIHKVPVLSRQKVCYRTLMLSE